MSTQFSIFDFSTSEGNVHGKLRDGVIRFENIRYAISERYQYPKAISVREGFSQQSEKPHVCHQIVYPLLDKMIEQPNIENFISDEAPQFLSITVPQHFQKMKELPVLVWIHGGSYEIGFGDLASSDPSLWVKEQNIIVVSISYRLGLFGFLGGFDDRPANLGMLDVIESLKWVHENIALFNGDAHNVTLLGQSSGGDLVAHLMIADIPTSLFHKVIIQSAPLGLRKNRMKMYKALSEKTHDFKDEENPMLMVNRQNEVLPKFNRFGMKALMPFGLQYGTFPLPSEAESLKNWRKSAKKYKVLIGLNNDETAFYLATSEALIRYLRYTLGQKILKKAVQFSTEKIYGSPAAQFAKNFKIGGGDVTLFRLHSTISKGIGAAHCFDLPLLFGDYSVWKNAGLLKNIPWSYIEENGKKLRYCWAEFMKKGRLPEKENLPDILEIRA